MGRTQQDGRQAAAPIPALAARWRRLWSLLAALALLLLTRAGRAESPSVPARLQAELTAKLLEYADVPSPRSVPVIRIGIVVKPGDAGSSHFANEFKAALADLPAVAGLPHEQLLLPWSSADELAAEAKRRQIFAVYLSPGLRAEVPAIAHAFEGSSILTFASVDTYVPAGAVLGFELISGRPKMICNLAQAGRQRVSFRASVMKLMRIVP